MALITATRTNNERTQYAEWLQGYRWDYFFTSTFRSPRKEPYYAIKAVTTELQQHNVARAFVVAEPHQSGDLHTHGILAGSIRQGRNLMASPEAIWQGLFNKFGRAKVELCHGQEAVANYCSKYIMKQQSRVCDFFEIYGNKLAWQRGQISPGDNASPILGSMPQLGANSRVLEALENSPTLNHVASRYREELSNV